MDPAAGTGTQQGTPGPAGPANRQKLRLTLRAMEQKLRQHSALEDLGPLFGPEARGQAKLSPKGQPEGQAF